MGDKEKCPGKSPGTRARTARGFGGTALAFVALACLSGLALLAGDYRRRSADPNPVAPPAPPPNSVRIALCQYENPCGSHLENQSRVIQVVRDAFACGATYVFLPELTFHGVRDVRNAGVLSEPIDESHLLEPLRAQAREHRGYIAVNLLTRDDIGIRNSSVLLDPHGEVLHTHHKTMLANADRIARLTPGEVVHAVETRHGNLVVLICREAAEILRMLDASAVEELPPAPLGLANEAMQVARSAHLVLIQMAFAGLTDSEPAHPMISDRLWSTPQRLMQLAMSWAQRSGAPVAIVNQTGAEGRARYVGHSTVVTPKGRIVALGGYAPRLVLVDLPLDAQGRIARDGEPHYAGDFEGRPLEMDGAAR